MPVIEQNSKAAFQDESIFILCCFKITYCRILPQTPPERGRCRFFLTIATTRLETWCITKRTQTAEQLSFYSVSRRPLFRTSRGLQKTLPSVVWPLCEDESGYLDTEEHAADDGTKSISKTRLALPTVLRVVNFSFYSKADFEVRLLLLSERMVVSENDFPHALLSASVQFFREHEY